MDEFAEPALVSGDVLEEFSRLPGTSPDAVAFSFSLEPFSPEVLLEKRNAARLHRWQASAVRGEEPVAEDGDAGQELALAALVLRVRARNAGIVAGNNRRLGALMWGALLRRVVGAGGY